MGVSTNTPRHPLTLVTPQATPSRRGTRPSSQVEESTSYVCISKSLSNPSHTMKVCLNSTTIFQTIESLNFTSIITGSSDLHGCLLAYHSGFPCVYYSMLRP